MRGSTDPVGLAPAACSIRLSGPDPTGLPTWLDSDESGVAGGVAGGRGSGGTGTCAAGITAVPHIPLLVRFGDRQLQLLRGPPSNRHPSGQETGSRPPGPGTLPPSPCDSQPSPSPSPRKPPPVPELNPAVRPREKAHGGAGPGALAARRRRNSPAVRRALVWETIGGQARCGLFAI